VASALSQAGVVGDPLNARSVENLTGALITSALREKQKGHEAGTGRSGRGAKPGPQAP
jgi:hypothetical protein